MYHFLKPIRMMGTIYSNLKICAESFVNVHIMKCGINLSRAMILSVHAYALIL